VAVKSTRDARAGAGRGVGEALDSKENAKIIASQLRSLVSALRGSSVADVAQGLPAAERQEILQELAMAFYGLVDGHPVAKGDGSAGGGEHAAFETFSSFDETQARPESRILVVDDNACNRLAFEAILKPLGHPVVTATSGEDALRHVLRQDFALALLDVQMPGMNGFELAALLRSRERIAHLPIIFVTAVSRDFKHVFTGFARGAVDYLLTPVEPELLRAKVRVFLELHRQQDQNRKRAVRLLELELRDHENRSRERLFRVTESIPLPVWGVRRDGRVYVCNAAWTEYSGLTVGQTGVLLGRDCVHPADVEHARSKWAQGTDCEQPFDVECRLRRKCGGYRWYQLRAVPERGADAIGEFWIVVGVDIDERKTSEQERALLLESEQRARADAESANRMKDEFLATISHELRTPLNAILGWARMLRTGMLGPTRVPQAVETIERSAQAQAKLVNDILDVSRIVSGKLRLQIGPIDLPTIVSDAIETVRPAADAKGIDFLWERPLWDVPTRGDPSRVQQIVWNLASNAVKFTPKGGRIRVWLDRDGDCARLFVKDNGMGIAPEFLPFIFDRFRQGNATTTRTHEGLGLGLSIVRHLVELHGGSVRAESAGPGQGAEFVVSLPWRAGPGDRSVPEVAAFRARANKGRARPKLPKLGGATVLFVDDHPEARALAETVFGHCGAKVTTAETAEDALRALMASVPDVLVSDIGLPGEDGYSLIRRVRALDASRGGNVPAIALTAYARPEDERRAWQEGFQVHLAKPVEPDELAGLVASLIAKRSRRGAAADPVEPKPAMNSDLQKPEKLRGG
jgi:PAS domain S-box-containing protein